MPIAVKAPAKSIRRIAKATLILSFHLPSTKYTANVTAILKCPPLSLPVSVAAINSPSAATEASFYEQLIPTRKSTIPKNSYRDI